VKANNASRAYAAANPTFTYTITGFKNGDTSKVVTGTATLTTTATTKSPVATYPITFATEPLTATNYSFTYVSGEMSVGRARLVVVAKSVSKVMGTANPPLTYTIEGFENGDTSKVVTGTATLTTTATTTSLVGKYPITFSTESLVATNYYFVYVDGEVTITRARLVVTAKSVSKVMGTANPPLTYTITGFQNGDTSKVVTGTATLTTTATTTSPVGGYPITFSTEGLTATNYYFVYVDGTLTVTAAP